MRDFAHRNVYYRIFFGSSRFSDIIRGSKFKVGHITLTTPF